MASSKILKGRDLMLFYNGKSIAYATNHTLNISSETSDISSKDHGIWGSTDVTKITWTISAENLFTADAYSQLFDLLVAGEPIEVKFGLKAEEDNTKTVADGDYPNWTPGTTTMYSGKVIMTSLNANANNGENATFSTEFQGVGKLTAVTA